MTCYLFLNPRKPTETTRQGLLGACTLTCVYVPTSLQKAWIWVMGHCSRADVEEFPLEGVRTIAGSIHKHYFGHLPPGLQRIDFGHNFNQSILEVDFPKSLQVLIFGNTFNQSLEHVVLPNNLQTLIFGHFGQVFG